ncbi:uncharacterized protein isoform X2 [Leptinotarsa decemlineata]
MERPDECEPFEEESGDESHLCEDLYCFSWDCDLSEEVHRKIEKFYRMYEREKDRRRSKDFKKSKNKKKHRKNKKKQRRNKKKQRKNKKKAVEKLKKAEEKEDPNIG